MDVSQFCSSTRLIIVAGKGGVGKTTVTAAIASMAAAEGLTSLIVEVDGKSGVGAMFGQAEPLTYDEVVLADGCGPGGVGQVRARALTPDDALVEYLYDHGMGRVSRRLASSGALDVVATAVPGIKDILVLGKVKQLEREGPVDLVVLDAPAAGHAVTFLTSARALADAARAGPIRVQAEAVVELLSDARRCQVILVTLPEETPVNEVVETAYRLEDTVGIKLGPLVVNGVYPQLAGLGEDPESVAERAGVDVTSGQVSALRAAADFRHRRQELQQRQLERLGERLPLDRVELPFLFTAEIGPPETQVLAGALATGLRAL